MPDDASPEGNGRASSGDTFTFGPLAFDPAAGLLHRGDQETLLPPNSSDSDLRGPDRCARLIEQESPRMRVTQPNDEMDTNDRVSRA